MDLDKFLEHTKKCQCLAEDDMKKVIIAARRILIEENTVVCVPSPAVVCGDIHGQFHDLLELFKVAGEIPSKSYVFMGDYVDRGFNSLETFTYLLLLKVRYSKNITLLRGNHETRQVTQIYGFHDECVRKYGQASVWRMCCDIFDCFPIAAVIDQKVMCIHAGLSPDVRTLDQMRKINRRREVPQFGALSDLMWSDPEDSLVSWSVNSRGAGWIFGSRIVTEFNYVNELKLICRSHQVADKGFKFHFKYPKKDEAAKADFKDGSDLYEGPLATVWSAPNYCYRCGNLAAAFDFDDKLNLDPKIFKEVEEMHKLTQQKQKQRPMYFL